VSQHFKVEGMDTKRPIVITPYYKEDPALLRRCMDSVRAQTVPAEHFLVADGHPQDWIDSEPSAISSSIALTAITATLQEVSRRCSPPPKGIPRS